MSSLEKYKNASRQSIPEPTKCVIGLDRDGVINHDLGTYVTSPAEFAPIPGSLEAMADLRRKGYKLVIITNQGGIEQGIMTANDVNAVHEYMLDLLGKAGCTSIDGIYYSASNNKRDPYAKPNIGMFKEFEIYDKSAKFSQGFYVGDKISDLKAALKIGARPVLVRTGYGLETEKELNKYTYRDIKQKTYVFDSLADFAANLE
jgi:D-glycero-D-manno-heptose 1,7-bisphosphate phosphatase